MKFKYRNKEYEVTPEKCYIWDDPVPTRDQLIFDLNSCIDQGNFVTLKNRITNGLTFGWLTPVE